MFICEIWYFSVTTEWQHRCLFGTTGSYIELQRQNFFQCIWAFIYSISVSSFFHSLSLVQTPTHHIRTDGHPFFYFISYEKSCVVCSSGRSFTPQLHRNWVAEVSMDRIRVGYPVGYLRFFWIFIFEKNWIRTGYLFDFYNEIFLRVIQDGTNDGAVAVFAMVFIFTKKQNYFVSMCCTSHNRR